MQYFKILTIKKCLLTNDNTFIYIAPRVASESAARNGSD